MKIRLFFHCKGCAPAKPANLSMRDWARLEVALTVDNKISVWCIRCERLVVVVPLDESAKETFKDAGCMCQPVGKCEHTKPI
jgi:hypothetical protein